MKGRAVILFASGTLCGWWVAGTPLASAALANWTGSSSAGGGGSLIAGTLQAGLPKEIDGQVLLSKERLNELVASGKSTALDATDFIRGRHETGLESLTKWLGLDDLSKQQLVRILQNAIASRLAWEKQNAKVEKPAVGKWIIDIAPDAGRSREELRKELVGVFGAEQAEIISLGADLDHFFDFSLLLKQPGSPSGRIEIEVVSLDHPSGGKRVVEFTNDEGLTASAIEGEIKNTDLSRLMHLLGSEEEISKWIPPFVVHPDDPFGAFDQENE